ncbi:MAG: EutN/CcmL family microcompartment protein, partial [Bryobacteraceae bacterium]
MQLGRVVGRMWCTQKNAGLTAQRLLVVEPCTPGGAAVGRRIICTDT